MMSPTVEYDIATTVLNSGALLVCCIVRFKRILLLNKLHQYKLYYVIHNAWACMK